MRPLYCPPCIELIFTHHTNNCGYRRVSTSSGVGIKPALDLSSMKDREGGPDVPVRIAGNVVPIASAQASNGAIVAIAEPKADGHKGRRSYALIYLNIYFFRGSAPQVPPMRLRRQVAREARRPRGSRTHRRQRRPNSERASQQWRHSSKCRTEGRRPQLWTAPH